LSSKPHENSQLEIKETAVQITEPTQEKYIIYWYRWIAISAYVIAILATGGIYAVFLPFSMYFQKIYGISHLVIVLTAYLFNTVYPITNFALANPIINKCGTKIAVFYKILKSMKSWDYLLVE